MARTKMVIVPRHEDMDDETFIRHLEVRHALECKIEGYVSRNAVGSWISVYRAFHDRLHKIARPGQYAHEHMLVEDDEED